MVRQLTAALLSIAVFWLGVLALSALGGAQIHEVLFSFAVAITLARAGADVHPVPDPDLAAERGAGLDERRRVHHAARS